MTNTPTLSPRKTYDSLVREVEPGRHVYRTRVTAGKWFGALADLGAAVFFVWVGRKFLQMSRDPFGYGLAIFFWLGGQKGSLFNPRINRTWNPGEAVGATVLVNPTFHPGGSTPLYGVALVLANGQELSLHSAIIELDDARALAEDMTESIRLAIEQPDGFGVPTLRATR